MDVSQETIVFFDAKFHHCPQPRVIAVRSDCGKFIADPQDVYDRLCAPLKKRQVNIPELFWVTDESEFLVQKSHHDHYYSVWFQLTDYHCHVRWPTKVLWYELVCWCSLQCRIPTKSCIYHIFVENPAWAFLVWWGPGFSASLDLRFMCGKLTWQCLAHVSLPWWDTRLQQEKVTSMPSKDPELPFEQLSIIRLTRISCWCRSASTHDWRLASENATTFVMVVVPLHIDKMIYCNIWDSTWRSQL